MYSALWDVVGFLLFGLLLGSFSLWLLAYFVFELVLYVFGGPSRQLRSVGSSILEEPPLEARLRGQSFASSSEPSSTGDKNALPPRRRPDAA